MTTDNMPYKEFLKTEIEDAAAMGKTAPTLVDCLVIKYGNFSRMLRMEGKTKSAKDWIYNVRIPITLESRFSRITGVNKFPGKSIYYTNGKIYIKRDLDDKLNSIDNVSESLVNEFSEALHYYMSDMKKTKKSQTLLNKRRGLYKSLKKIDGSLGQFVDIMGQHYGTNLANILINRQDYWTEERRIQELVTIRDHLIGRLDYDEKNPLHARVKLLEKENFKAYVDVLASHAYRCAPEEIKTTATLANNVINNHLVSTEFQTATADMTNTQKRNFQQKHLMAVLQNMHMVYSDSKPHEETEDLFVSYRSENMRILKKNEKKESDSKDFMPDKKLQGSLALVMTR